MNSVITSSSVARESLRPASPELCLFHNGLATLDLFLAELDPRDHALFDAALDLRSFAAGTDAAACIEQLFRVRALLDGRHYLSFYRVRCWARRTFRIEVRAHRGAALHVCDFPLDGGRLDEVVNSSLATVSIDGELPAFACVRFVFAGARA
ncbi:MAG: hypothetical protein WDM96_10670 [Lacunisphaera sp.]